MPHTPGSSLGPWHPSRHAQCRGQGQAMEGVVEAGSEPLSPSPVAVLHSWGPIWTLQRGLPALHIRGFSSLSPTPAPCDSRVPLGKMLFSRHIGPSAVRVATPASQRCVAFSGENAHADALTVLVGCGACPLLTSGASGPSVAAGDGAVGPLGVPARYTQSDTGPQPTLQTYYRTGAPNSIPGRGRLPGLPPPHGPAAACALQGPRSLQDGPHSGLPRFPYQLPAATLFPVPSWISRGCTPQRWWGWHRLTRQSTPVWGSHMETPTC